MLAFLASSITLSPSPYSCLPLYVMSPSLLSCLPLDYPVSLSILMHGFGFAGTLPGGQRDITLGIMRSLMPPGGDKVFRKLFPTNKWSLELNAKITEVVFGWMVGSR